MGIVLHRTAIEERVVLVDEHANPIGEQAKSTVHHRTTPLHLAFSLYLFDERQHLLMTRRALGKVTWPGVWTNTCCGHPQPGEATPEAVTRRLDAELGLRVSGLRPVLPDFAYRVEDVSGIWENEICPVYAGTVVDPDEMRPHPGEVMDSAWVPWDDVVTAVTATPFAFSPWAVLQIGELGRSGAAAAAELVREGAK